MKVDIEVLWGVGSIQQLVWAVAMSVAAGQALAVLVELAVADLALPAPDVLTSSMLAATSGLMVKSSEGQRPSIPRRRESVRNRRRASASCLDRSLALAELPMGRPTLRFFLAPPAADELVLARLALFAG